MASQHPDGLENETFYKHKYWVALNLSSQKKMPACIFIKRTSVIGKIKKIKEQCLNHV